MLLSCLLSACASLEPPSAEELEQADYGIEISQDQAQRIVQSYLNKYLKDPRFAQYEWGHFHKAWIRRAIINGGGKVFGYRLDVNINAKNSFGGYTGFKQYMFMLYNGGIKVVYAERDLNGGDPIMMEIYYDSKLGRL